MAKTNGRHGPRGRYSSIKECASRKTKHRSKLRVAYRNMMHRCGLGVAAQPDGVPAPVTGYADHHGDNYKDVQAWPAFRDARPHPDRGFTYGYWAFHDMFAPQLGPGLSVDRINPYGHYFPSNMRPATVKQQACNKRIVRNLKVDGKKEHDIYHWAAASGIDIYVIHCRIKAGWTDNNAVKPQAHP